MSNVERRLIVGVLVFVIMLVGADLLSDNGEGVSVWHVIAEGIAGLAAALGILYLMRGTFWLRHRLRDEVERSTALQVEAERWRADARRFVDGLSKVIDQQLTRWELTPAEKEVAFLLLKGLGSREIAAIRKTSEKTVRAQSSAIYAKAGLVGRTELAAFFLEDLLVPQVA